MTRMRGRSGGAALLALTLILALTGVEAATKPASAPDSSPIQILPGTSSKEPITIDADKLVYSDKERKAVYSGNVVVIQGDTKMTCSVMTVFLDHSPTPAANAAAPAASAPAPATRRAVHKFGYQAPRGDRTGDSDLEDPGRDRRQRHLRQGGEQGAADRTRHAQRRPERHQGRQADLRSRRRARRRSTPEAPNRDASTGNSFPAGAPIRPRRSRSDDPLPRPRGPSAQSDTSAAT